jgi:biotin transporter BioY
MRTRLKAALVAFVFSLPFVIAAGSFAQKAATSTTPGYYYSFLSALIYLLGSPLTLLIFGFIKYVRPLDYADNWWAIPAMSGLFILQWIIWAQLLVSVARRFSRREGPQAHQ